MNETERLTWEDTNPSIMEDLLQEKARSCESFKQCLIMNKDKILAESTFNKRWGTGLLKGLTELTKPEYWPGNNLLGIMLMELTTHITCSQPTSMETDNEVQVVQNSDNDDESDAQSETDQDSLQDAPEAPDIPSTSVTATNTKSTKKDDPVKKKSKRKKVKVSPPSKDGAQNKDNGNKTDNTLKNTKSNEKDKQMQNTPAKQNMPDIRDYMDPSTGKRKSPDTTPEKNNNEKKHMTKDSI